MSATPGDYDIRLDERYGPLELIDIAAEAAEHQPWFNQTLTRVNDAVVRLGVLEGDFHWHSTTTRTSSSSCSRDGSSSTSTARTA